MSSSGGNVFQQVMSNAGNVKEQLLGPDYPYYKYVKTPDSIGMSGKGTLKQLGKDIDGLTAYVELLVSGKSRASATGRPLGNRFFMKTGAKCKAADTGAVVDRYIFVDNVPAGNIPFISSGMGVNFSEMKGLIPGTISNLNALNPFNILQSFMAGGTPDCRKLTMDTINSKNVKKAETQYVTNVDIGNMDPCSFRDRRNPITKAKCKETFQGMDDSSTLSPAEYRDAVTGTFDLLVVMAVLGGLAVYMKQHG